MNNPGGLFMFAPIILLLDRPFFVYPFSFYFVFYSRTITRLREVFATAKVFKSTPTAVEEYDGSRSFDHRRFSLRPGYPQVVRIKRGFERRFHSPAAQAESVLVPIAEAASDLLCEIDFALIKKCANAACILYFYDTTKDHRRNWCSMHLCGNRMKVAAFFQRMRKNKQP